jgi:hypothetical protein
MSRLTITLTAAAVSALVATAIVALPAIGEDSGTPADKDAAFAQLVACLRSHGLDGAPASPQTLKPWLVDDARDPAVVKAALQACEPPGSKAKRDDKRGVAGPDAGPDVQKLAACLRANGLDAPSDPDALKRWLAQKEASDPAAVKRVVPNCKMQLDPAGAKAAKPAVCVDDGQHKPAEPAKQPDAGAEPTT